MYYAIVIFMKDRTLLQNMAFFYLRWSSIHSMRQLPSDPMDRFLGNILPEMISSRGEEPQSSFAIWCKKKKIPESKPRIKLIERMTSLKNFVMSLTRLGVVAVIAVTWILEEVEELFFRQSPFWNNVYVIVIICHKPVTWNKCMPHNIDNESMHTSQN